MREILIALACLMFLAALDGCNKTIDKNEPDVQPTFVSIQTNILVPKCLQCHNQGHSSGNVDLSSYDKVMDVVSPTHSGRSILWTEINTGAMPLRSPKLPQNQIDAVALWIDNGAQK